MTRLCSATSCMLMLLAVTIPSWAKGYTVHVEIMGGETVVHS
jgi:hypothetical protein